MASRAAVLMSDVLAGAVGFHGVENGVVAHELVPLRQASRALRGENGLFYGSGGENRPGGLAIPGCVAAPVAQAEAEREDHDCQRRARGDRAPPYPSGHGLEALFGLFREGGHKLAREIRMRRFGLRLCGVEGLIDGLRQAIPRLAHGAKILIDVLSMLGHGAPLIGGNGGGRVQEHPERVERVRGGVIVEPRKLLGPIQLRLRGADRSFCSALIDGLPHGIQDLTPANCSSIALSQWPTRERLNTPSGGSV